MLCVHVFSGALSPLQRFLAEFEEEEVEVGNPAGLVNDAADDGIEGFDASAGDAVLVEVEDLFLGFEQAFGKAFEFGDAALRGHGDPAGEPFVGTPAIGIGPDLTKGVFEQVGHGEVAGWQPAGCRVGGVLRCLLSPPKQLHIA